MIKSFADDETEKVFRQQFSRKLPHDIQRRALRKLIMLDNTKTLDDLRSPPGNHLEELRGDREGQHSIRINEQFRICFVVAEDGLDRVEIVDYH
ncbi:MAG: type II toxin-antitoxin system RelE/ParE family toxin [Synergistaceae bacterium]|nr:type II toxin-antitoxin system RelE/ParE family toxin [Synergistaceae bacterium]